jgi:hypothetical protein
MENTGRFRRITYEAGGYTARNNEREFGPNIRWEYNNIEVYMEENLAGIAIDTY